MDLMHLELVKAGILGLVVLLVLAIVNRRDDRAQGNFQEMLKIAMANTEALTKMTASVEGLAEIVAHAAETSSKSTEMVASLVEIVKARLIPPTGG